VTEPEILLPTEAARRIGVATRVIVQAATTQAQGEHRCLYEAWSVYTRRVAKHLVDIDEQALSAARAELGTNTIRDTVNEALNLAAGARATEVKRALDRLARLELDDREDAWR